MKENVFFDYQASTRMPEQKKKLKKFIINMFDREGVDLDRMRFIFCTDEFLHEINKRHLNHDYYTDVITFNYADNGKPVVSESYISIDRVKENAKTFNITFKQEIHRVVFHSVLHLCGYNDKTQRERNIMKELENQYLQLYFS